jgi:hypothetical protein
MFNVRTHQNIQSAGRRLVLIAPIWGQLLQTCRMPSIWFAAPLSTLALVSSDVSNNCSKKGYSFLSLKTGTTDVHNQMTFSVFLTVQLSQIRVNIPSRSNSTVLTRFWNSLWLLLLRKAKRVDLSDRILLTYMPEIVQLPSGRQLLTKFKYFEIFP